MLVLVELELELELMNAAVEDVDAVGVWLPWPSISRAACGAIKPGLRARLAAARSSRVLAYATAYKFAYIRARGGRLS